MKKNGFALMITLCVLYLSCKKTQQIPGEVYGTWKLTEILQDPGDGSGKYIKVTGDAKYLTLEQSGKIIGDAIPGLYAFKILDSVRMEVTSKNYVLPDTYYYKATNTTLTLNPPCIEGCGFRFKRQ